MDLALNNLQGLICHKTKQTKPNLKGSTTPVLSGPGNNDNKEYSTFLKASEL